MSKSNYDAIVIGSGIAGLAATKRLLEGSNFSVASFESELFGGLVINIQELDGKIAGSGVDLASGLMMEVTEAGALMLSEQVTAIAEDEGGWTVTTTEGLHHARSVVVASGASLKRLGVPGEEKFEYKGVSRCADCDGPVYRGKEVVVAGGGDSALQEARILAGFCRQVYLLNRGSQFTAQPHLIEAIGGCGNVTVRHLTEVEALLGNEVLETVQVRNLADSSVSEVACSGFFGFVGLKPTTEFIPASVARDANGFLVTDSSFTAGNGLFAVGAVRSGYGGMLEHAVAEGLAAADGAIKVLNEIR